MGDLLARIKRVIRKSRYVKVAACGAAWAPTSPGRVIVQEKAQGLRLLCTVDTAAEAGWLQQVLVEAGFHQEYIPSTTAGLFGVAGNTSIYVKPEEFDDAAEFLHAYLNAPHLEQLDEIIP
jgi:hypothetical protein